MTEAPTIAVLGMTHLGLVTAAASAARGANVIAIDARSHHVDALRRGEWPVVERGLDDAVSDATGRLRFSDAVSDCADADVVVVAPDAPTDDAGRSDLAPIRFYLDAALTHRAKSASVVVLSQIPPGFLRSAAAGAPLVFHQVETLVFGDAVRRARSPERFIVGCADPTDGLPERYAAYLALFDCPVLPMRYESAELAKIAINLCLTAHISTANVLAAISEAIGADYAEIAPALRLDGRIGAKAYLDPGLGLAGGNLERDLTTITRIAAERDVDARFVAAQQNVSAGRRNWAVETLRAAAPSARRIAFWGLTYKPGTASLKNAPALSAVDSLVDCEIAAWDPAAPDVDGVLRAATPMDAVAAADALIVFTPWPEIQSIAPSALADALTGTVVVDPFGALDGLACAAAGLEHHRLGRKALRAEEHV